MRTAMKIGTKLMTYWAYTYFASTYCVTDNLELQDFTFYTQCENIGYYSTGRKCQVVP